MCCITYTLCIALWSASISLGEPGVIERYLKQRQGKHCVVANVKDTMSVVCIPLRSEYKNYRGNSQ